MDFDARTGWIPRVMRAAAVPFALLFCSAPALANENPWDGNWHTDLTFYGWLPGVTGDFRFQTPDGGHAETKSDNNILDKLQGAFMVQTVVRQGEWGVFADLDWVKFGDQNGRFTSIGGENVGADINLSTRWNVKGGMLTLAGLYSLSHDTWGFADVLFGARYLWIKGNVSWDFSATGNDGFQIADSGHIAQNGHVTDGVIGLRGRINLGDGHWFAPYYIDAGAGSDNTTWQAVLGVGYGFDWGALGLVWRHVNYSQTGDSDLIRRIAFDGPAFAVNFHW